MWTIDRPTIPALETFDTCIAGIRNAGLKQRLVDVRDDIAAQEENYEATAQASELYTVPTATHVGEVTAKEMEKLYDRHMARGNSRGRVIYDKLMIKAENDICPFCGHRTVSTLDHCLQKNTHPAFAVTPINLIPCCKDCNHAKGTTAAAVAEEQLLNAYYDDVTTDRWLFAEIVEGTPAAARFYAAPPAHWDDVLKARVENHFALLALAKLYASQASRQLQNMRRALGEIYDAAGAAAVRSDLERQFRSCQEVAINSWEGALYQAAAASPWFCGDGFRA